MLKDPFRAAFSKVFGLPSHRRYSPSKLSSSKRRNQSRRILSLRVAFFEALDTLQPPFSSDERRKSALLANDNYLAQNKKKTKAYDDKTKSLMCQSALLTIYLGLVHGVLDISKSTSTY